MILNGINYCNKVESKCVVRSRVAKIISFLDVHKEINKSARRKAFDGMK